MQHVTVSLLMYLALPKTHCNRLPFFDIQVLGTGDRKVLTLSHRAQVKRFIADVLKVLKTQPGKQLAVSELPATFGEFFCGGWEHVGGTGENLANAGIGTADWK